MTTSRVRTARWSAGLVAAALVLSGCGAADLGRSAARALDAPGADPTVSSATAPPPTQSPTSGPTPTGTPAPTQTTPKPVTPTQRPVTPAPAAKALLGKGDTGDKVRELQHRLSQLDWFAGTITGTYGTSTQAGVRGFQDKRGLATTGSVDAVTWSKLVSMTRQPTDAELHNKLVPGKALCKQGSTGDQVRALQARLKQIGWFSGSVTTTYGSATAAAVRGFQAKRAIPVTGEVDQRTLSRLTAMTHTPTSDELNNRTPKPSAAGLDPRCFYAGNAMCISKTTDSLVWVVAGKPQLRVDVRFGSYQTPTREGFFTVGWKSRYHVSTIYHSKMPYAMFFSRGQAVHYSSDFAARGYAGASHGCVNVRDLAGIQTLFAQAKVGDRVIVYR